MPATRLIFLLFSLLISLSGLSQATLSTKNKKAIDLYRSADNYRVRGQYAQAISLLQDAIRKDNGFIEAYVRLGSIHKFVKDYPRALLVLTEAYKIRPNDRQHAILYLELAEVHLYLEEYEKAEALATQFLDLSPTHPNQKQAAIEVQKNARFALENLQLASEFNPVPLQEEVNRFFMQYFPVLTADRQQLIYTRRLGPRPEDDEDLVISYLQNDGSWSAPQSISPNINSPGNEGTCSISADGRILIFTSCFGRKGYGKCDLYISKKSGNEWSIPENLGPMVNTGAWESQPSLSADGRTLYFVSDRAGFGKTDIWVTRLDAEGNWQKPQNLGATINTSGDEISPFIHPNGRVLYFASNGHPGFGGFDLFYSEWENGAWSKPVNMGAPLNNAEDQLSLFITADGKKGYYSNEKHQGDIKKFRGLLYEFEVPEALQVKYKSNYIRGQVLDKVTGKPLKAVVELFDLANEEMVAMVESDAVTGDYMMVLTEGAGYALYVNKEGYLFESLSFDYAQRDNFEPILLDIHLQPIDKGVSVTLNNLFFDTDKYEIKESSYTELNKVVRFLMENPSLRIEISGHTDDVGSKAYNQQLSEKRASSVRDYLISKGIPTSRLLSKGYGDSRPKTPNTNEANRQMNRRIEFRVL
jgi:OmpA-OmpF porin, OOP family